MKIEIYGKEGCKTCTDLKKKVEEIVEDMEKEVEVEKVTDFTKLAKKGIMSVPALAIDGDLKFKGKSPDRKEIKEIINNV